jgi:hypothetical protein
MITFASVKLPEAPEIIAEHLLKTMEVVDINKKEDRGDIGNQSRRFEDTIDWSLPRYFFSSRGRILICLGYVYFKSQLQLEISTR